MKIKNINNLLARLSMALSVMAMLALGSCKTTVKNYQDAYDVARQKRERDEQRRRELQDDLGVDRAKLEQVDAPSISSIGLRDDATGETMEIKTAAVPFHRDDKVRGVVLAVARFKMPTNAESLAADLREEGFKDAKTARSGEEFWVLIGEGTYPAELAPTAFRFHRRLPDFPYVGIGQMLLVYPR